MDNQPDSDRPLHFVAFDNRTLRASLRTITAWIALAAVAYWIVMSNAHFLFLLLMSFLIAIAMEPAIRRLTQRGMRRGLATSIVLGGVIVIVIAFLAAFGGILFSQAASLVTELPYAVTQIVEWLNSSFSLKLDANKIVSSLNVSPSQIASWASSVAGGVLGIVTAVVGGIFQFLTMLLFTFYIAADGPRLRRTIGSWLNPRAQSIFVTTWDIAVAKTGGFVASKVVMAALSTAAHAAFFALIGLPYWLPLALITGIVSQFVPTVGTYIGIVVPILFAVISNDPIDAVWILIFASIYQQIENYLISPRISKITMKIHPAVAFGSVIVFANIFGPMGAIIAIPLAAAIVAVIDTYGNRYDLIPELTLDEILEELAE